MDQLNSRFPRWAQCQSDSWKLPKISGSPWLWIRISPEYEDRWTSSLHLDLELLSKLSMQGWAWHQLERSKSWDGFVETGRSSQSVELWQVEARERCEVGCNGFERLKTNDCFDISSNSLTRMLELRMSVDMRRNDDAIVISDSRTILQSSPFHVTIVGVEECRGAGLLFEEGVARWNERILAAARVVAAAQTSFVWNCSVIDFSSLQFNSLKSLSFSGIQQGAWIVRLFLVRRSWFPYLM